MSNLGLYFEIVPRSGGYRALLKSAGNHELIWYTEVYKYKTGAQHAIDLAKAYAPSAPVYDRT